MNILIGIMVLIWSIMMIIMAIYKKEIWNNIYNRLK
jgi:hypothetical protein